MESAEPCICCRSVVLFMPCFLLSEEQSHETNVLYRTAVPNNASPCAQVMPVLLQL